MVKLSKHMIQTGSFDFSSEVKSNSQFKRHPSLVCSLIPKPNLPTRGEWSEAVVVRGGYGSHLRLSPPSSRASKFSLRIRLPSMTVSLHVYRHKYYLVIFVY